MLGTALYLKGDNQAARAVLEPLAADNPDWAEVRLELGRVLGVLGENHAAIAVLTEAVNIDRNLSAAWSALGEQYVLIGDVLASDAAYSHHFNVAVTEPQLQKAVTALRNGRPDITEDILIEFLEHNPDHVNALKMLAEAAIAQDRNEDASALLERCLELAPDFGAARYRLVSSLYLQNRLHEGMPHIEMLLEKDPLNPQFRTMKASLLGPDGQRSGCADAVLRAGAGISQASCVVDQLRPRAQIRRQAGRRRARLPQGDRAAAPARRRLLEPGEPQDLPLHRRRHRRDAAPARARRPARRGARAVLLLPGQGA